MPLGLKNKVGLCFGKCSISADQHSTYQRRKWRHSQRIPPRYCSRPCKFTYKTMALSEQALRDDSAFIIKSRRYGVYSPAIRTLSLMGGRSSIQSEIYCHPAGGVLFHTEPPVPQPALVSRHNCRYGRRLSILLKLVEKPTAENIYGWAVRCDYRVYESRDINRFTNVRRQCQRRCPTENAVTASIAVAGSCAFNLDRHDNTFMVNVISLAKDSLIKTTTQGTSYLGGLSLSNFMADRMVPEFDIDSDSPPIFNRQRFLY